MNKIFLYLLIVLATPMAKAQWQTGAIDSIIDHAIQQQGFEGTILIAEQGQPVWQLTTGFRDTAQTQPIDNNTRFSIASVTKMFTAIVILQLVDEGKLQLDSKLVTLLPDVQVPGNDKITVHHLLLHIAGLPNEADNIYMAPTEPAAFVQQTIEGMNGNKKFGAFNYANIDYVLLGMIIEKTEGKSWQSAVQERLLDKLGMHNTGFLAMNSYPDNFAYTSTFNEDGTRYADPAFYIENFYAAGCMYSTAANLLLLDQGMYGNTLLSEEAKTRMFTSYPEYNYTGYSVWTYRYPFLSAQPLVMERRGGIMGANVVLMRLLEINRTIIILSNNNLFHPDSFGDATNLREALLRVVAPS